MNSEDALVRAGRVRGCIFGGAVGDALGAPVEFLSLAEIRTQFGSDGLTGYEPAYGRRGAFTDDTQMTLWAVEGLMRADNRGRDRGVCSLSLPDVVWNAYLRWLATQEGEGAVTSRAPEYLFNGWLYDQTVMHNRRAPGNTCLSALRRGKWGEAQQARNDSKGCGGVMRIAPVGLVCEEPFRDGCDVAHLTHGHPSGYLAAGAFALIVSRLMRGASLLEATGDALTVLETHPGHEETTRAIESAVGLSKQGEPSAETVESLGAGWVAEEALAIGLYCAMVARNFRHGVLLAVNHGGDSDSTGSMAGQLLGTQLGIASIPEPWLAGLEGRDVIEQLTTGLIEHFIDTPPAWANDIWPPTPDFDRYPPN